MEESKRRSVNYKRIDEEFMSQPQFIHILKRLINFIDNNNLNDQDLQRVDVIQNLLKYAFNLKKQPNEDHVSSIQVLFHNTSVNDFKQQLYRYSCCIAIFLWVSRVQKVVENGEKKFLTSWHSLYQLYCSLMEVENIRTPTKVLQKNQNLLIFRSTLRCTDGLFQGMKTFINENFQGNFNEVQKNDITWHARRFLLERIKNKKIQRPLKPSENVSVENDVPRPRGRPRRIINLLKSSSAPNNITAEVQACQQIDNVEFADAPVQTNENELTPDLVLNEHVTPAGSEDQERVEEPSTNNLHDLPACTPVENFEESGEATQSPQSPEFIVSLGSDISVYQISEIIRDLNEPVLKRKADSSSNQSSKKIKVEVHSEDLVDDESSNESLIIEEDKLQFQQQQAFDQASAHVHEENENEIQSASLSNLSNVESSTAPTMEKGRVSLQLPTEKRRTLNPPHSSQTPTPTPVIDLLEIEDQQNEDNNHESTSSSLCTFKNRRILNMLEQHWKNREHCDITLITDCGREIPAHKVFLSSACPVFYDYLKDNPGETEIAVRNTSFKTLTAMLRFIYSRKLDSKDDQETVGDVLQAAYEFKIYDLIDVCKEYLRKNLNKTNAFDTLEICIDLSEKGYKDMNDLIKIVEEFILRLMKTIRSLKI